MYARLASSGMSGKERGEWRWEVQLGLSSGLNCPDGSTRLLCAFEILDRGGSGQSISNRFCRNEFYELASGRHMQL